MLLPTGINEDYGMVKVLKEPQPAAGRFHEGQSKESSESRPLNISTGCSKLKERNKNTAVYTTTSALQQNRKKVPSTVNRYLNNDHIRSKEAIITEPAQIDENNDEIYLRFLKYKHNKK